MSLIGRSGYLAWAKLAWGARAYPVSAAMPANTSRRFIAVIPGSRDGLERNRAGRQLPEIALGRQDAPIRGHHQDRSRRHVRWGAIQTDACPQRSGAPKFTPLSASQASRHSLD